MDVHSIITMRKCDHPLHPISRRENSRYYRELLQSIRENFGLSMSEGSRDWAIRELDRAYLIFGKPRNELPFCDEHIPFYQMVYHGFLLYNNARSYVNAFPGSAGYAENIRWGGLPLVYFHHIFNPDWSSASAWASDLRPNSPERLTRDVAVIKKMSDDTQQLAPTQLAFWDDYIVHSAALTETCYSNGMRVFVNRGDREETLPDGGKLAPFAFVIRSNNGQK